MLFTLHPPGLITQRLSIADIAPPARIIYMALMAGAPGSLQRLHFAGATVQTRRAVLRTRLKTMCILIKNAYIAERRSNAIAQGSDYIASLGLLDNPFYV